MKKQIMAAFVASLIVISGAQGYLLPLTPTLNGQLKPDDGQNALSNGRKR